MGYRVVDHERLVESSRILCDRSRAIVESAIDTVARSRRIIEEIEGSEPPRPTTAPSYGHG